MFRANAAGWIASPLDRGDDRRRIRPTCPVRSTNADATPSWNSAGSERAIAVIRVRDRSPGDDEQSTC